MNKFTGKRILRIITADSLEDMDLDDMLDLLVDLEGREYAAYLTEYDGEQVLVIHNFSLGDPSPEDIEKFIEEN